MFRRICVKTIVILLSVIFFSPHHTYSAQSAHPLPNKEKPQNYETDFPVSPDIRQKLEGDADFTEALSITMPLSPEELRIAREKKEALDTLQSPRPAQMRTETRQIHVTPGSVPQIVRLTEGYTSTILFQDNTGRPWPVLSVVLGNPGAFSALQPGIASQAHATQGKNAEKSGLSRTDENNASHVLNLIPLTERANSNLAVTLEDCPYPVILQLLTESPHQRRRSDALIVFRLDSTGPNARIPGLTPPTPPSVSEEMLTFIHGIPPKEAKAMKLSPRPANVRLWQWRNTLYLRTPHALIWPAWTQVASGEDLNVYRLPKTRSLVISLDGVYTRLRVGGMYDKE